MNRKDFLKAGLVMIGGVWVPKQQGATIIVRGPVQHPSGGSPAWTDTLDFSTTDNSSSWIGGTSLIWAGITLTAGTASKLRIKIADYTASGNVKLGLYDNGGSKLQEVVVAVSGNGTIEGTITNESVSAANYFVAAISDSGDSAFKWADLRGSGTTNYNGSASFYTLPASLPSNDGPVTRTMAAGVFITP